MMSHISFPFKSAFFIGDIFSSSNSSSSSSSRARQTESDRKWRFEGVFCLSLSFSASAFARAFLLRSFLDDGFVCCSLVVLWLLELNWCLGFFTHTKALYFL